ncbi:hypothetical protein Syun_018910 [Stephania yunnanensis]|uniref:Uncharacterized protein n=1 Tax=Stephania yunnanensis TaxID=152371 RepID=A0AAP0IUR0_9MAGN
MQAIWMCGAARAATTEQTDTLLADAITLIPVCTEGGLSPTMAPLHSCITKLTAEGCRPEDSVRVLETAIRSHGRACLSSADHDRQIKALKLSHGFMCEGLLWE